MFAQHLIAALVYAACVPVDATVSSLQGPSVLQAIDAFKPAERATSKPFRMPITDVFKGQRGGISVGGKLEGGAVKVGTMVRVVPSNETGTVRSIQVDGEAATLARAGDTADLTLAGTACTSLQWTALKQSWCGHGVLAIFYAC